MPKKILVTGAHGLLGSSLTPYLRSCGYHIISISRKDNSDIQADLTDLKKVNVELTKIMPDVIVNLSALTDVDECDKEPQKAYLLNVRIVENLTSWIHKNRNKCHLVQISTDQVYDGVGPYKEDAITLTNYYSFSKYAGELAALSVFSTVLRTNFFGPSRCLGRSSLSDWLVTSLRNNKSITVFDDVKFSPLSIKKLVELIEIVIDRPIEGVFNVGSRNGLSKADFAFSLANVLSLSTKSMVKDSSKKIELKAYRPKDMRMDSTLFEKTFKLEVPSLKEEIESMKGAYINEIK